MKIKNQKRFLLFTLIFIFDAVYLYQPSKEITAMILSLFLLRQIKKGKRRRNLWILLGLFCYALVFRIYYLFLFLFYVLYLIYRKKKRLAVSLFAFGVILFCFLFQAGYLEVLINAKIVVEDANTALTDLFSKEAMLNNVILYLVNYCVMLLRLLFPVEIIIKSPSRAIMFLPVYWFMILYIVRGFALRIHQRKEGLKEERALSDCLIIICSHIMMSAFFEPDFGSYFRHLIGILPIYYSVMFEYQYKRVKLRLFETSIRFRQVSASTANCQLQEVENYEES